MPIIGWAWTQSKGLAGAANLHLSKPRLRSTGICHHHVSTMHNRRPTGQEVLSAVHATGKTTPHTSAGLPLQSTRHREHSVTRWWNVTHEARLLSKGLSCSPHLRRKPSYSPRLPGPPGPTRWRYKEHGQEQEMPPVNVSDRMCWSPRGGERVTASQVR